MARGVLDIELLAFHISIYLMGSPVGYEMTHHRELPCPLYLYSMWKGIAFSGIHSVWFCVHMMCALSYTFQNSSEPCYADAAYTPEATASPRSLLQTYDLQFTPAVLSQFTTKSPIDSHEHENLRCVGLHQSLEQVAQPLQRGH